jgi:hypothetical protein
MKWLLIIANVAAAVALCFLGNFAGAAHQAHAYSVYQELRSRNVLVERPDYNIEKRLSTIADGGAYSLWIAEIGAGICFVNAISIGILFRRKPFKSNSTPN